MSLQFQCLMWVLMCNASLQQCIECHHSAELLCKMLHFVVIVAHCNITVLYSISRKYSVPSLYFVLHCIIKWSILTSQYYTVTSWCSIVSSQCPAMLSQCSRATTMIYGVTTVLCFAPNAELWYHNASLCPNNFALCHHNPLFYHNKLHLNATKLQCTSTVPHHVIMV